MTCADFARVGQLLLNKGQWLDGTGTPFGLLNASWIKSMFTPQYPHAIGEAKMASQYTLLSYLLNNNTNASFHGGKVPSASAQQPARSGLLGSVKGNVRLLAPCGCGRDPAQNTKKLLQVSGRVHRRSTVLFARRATTTPTAW